MSRAVQPYAPPPPYAPFAPVAPRSRTPPLARLALGCALGCAGLVLLAMIGTAVGAWWLLRPRAR